jgi:hypothetical protein
MLRILHLDAGRELRGGQWQVLRLVEGLAAAGVESTVMARAGAPLYEAARKRGWRVEPLSLGRAAIVARRYDLLHAHDAHSHTVGAIARGGALVVSRRVAFPIGSRWKYNRARRYVAVSEFVKSVLVEGGVAEEKISVVHDGVPLLEPSHGTKVMTPAYRDDPQKCAPLVEAAARLAGIYLHPCTTDLESQLSEAAIFVYISHSEGLGSGALMAMSAGVPVIASRVGGLPEAIRHRENGLLVDNSAAEIAAAIDELRANPDLARKLGAAGRLTVMERFTVEHMARRTMEVYRRVLT